MERIKIKSGDDSFFYFKEYLTRLQPQADRLKQSFETIAEFQKPLSGKVLVEILNSPPAFFATVRSNAENWIQKQRPIQQTALADTCENLIYKTERSFDEFNKALRNHQIYNGTPYPDEVIETEKLSEFLYSNLQPETVRPLFDEYLTTKEELAFYACMQKLADANNNAAKMAKHWSHEMAPTASFLDYDHAENKFKVKTEFLKRYLNS